jgi:hypothetical protein
MSTSAAARRYLVWGTAALPVGLACAAIGQTAIGSVVTVIAWGLLIGGLHAFGRTGPDTGDSP